MQGIPGEKRCALYKWVPGVQLSTRIDPRMYRQLGAIMAKLHKHAESLHLPDHINPKLWDKVFYYPDEPVVYNTPKYSHLFPPEQVNIMDHAFAPGAPFLQTCIAKTEKRS